MYTLRIFVLVRGRSFWVSSLVRSCGDGLRVYGRVTLYYPDKLSFGKRCTLNEGVILDARGGIQIGHNVRLSSYSVIETGYLEKSGCPRQHGARPIVIGNNVWVASGAKILAGVTIGENSIIAAGAVVTKSVPPNSLAKGIPAQIFPLE